MATLEELKGLLKEASPLPWRHNQWMNTRNNTVMADEVKSAGHVIVRDVHREEDVSLIVAAVNSLPALIACVAALKKLSFQAQTSGGVAGRDDALFEAIGVAEKALSALDRSSKEDGR